jgi:hypothetical protein
MASALEYRQECIIREIHPNRERIAALDAELMAIAIMGDWRDDEVARANEICRELQGLISVNVRL